MFFGAFGTRETVAREAVAWTLVRKTIRLTTCVGAGPGTPCDMRIRVLWQSRLWPAVLLLSVLAGCSTPASRIRNAPELFASCTPEQQALIKEGKVGLGFDEDMVRLAVGEPDNKWSRVDAAGESEMWAYTRFETADGLPLYRGAYHRYHDDAYPYYQYYPLRKSEDYFRVVFKAGRVVSVETNTLK